MTDTTSPKGKKKAVIAYITFIGMFIAYTMNRDDKDAFATAHIKNMCGLVFGLLIAQTTQAYIYPELGDILWWAAFSLWIYSLVTVFQNKEPNIPFLSAKFQEWFTFLN
ncbi:MAG: FtsH-binding integral membrane protein [Patiriisocius sp.]|jgi:FtsH-binding integral membrane protein